MTRTRTTTPLTTPLTTSHRTRRALLAAAAAGVLALTLAACGSGGMGGMDHGTAPTTPAPASASATGHDMAAMGGMEGMDHGTAPAGAAGADGLAAERGGYRLDGALAGSEYRFTVTGPDGRVLTSYRPDTTKEMHFYAIRADLSGFQHLHPVRAADGGWTAPLAALAPGDWRMYASFVPGAGSGAGTGLVLSRTVTVPGQAEPVPLPAAAGSTTADGYTVTVAGAPRAGTAGELTVTVSRDGQPVTDLQPYLETYAHLTAFHAGDRAFAHLHPEAKAVEGAGGGPTLAFHAELPKPGDWRLFLQFQTGGTLHTAAVTLNVAA
ncbi:MULTISPECIES: hypothetical protein [Kitasatospora]|uniref:Uncharacterized protein n=1 Tax=Kitasatospora setae (strain ATCC 33774 / DSM 43861 / JCM 3304 / KCC A-0304 / NBRC 14216 / KM-6054) TaxID=452652 RepID=E4NEN4_KITSK|nr:MULTISPECIES: hypothetical protein [Kitasatospora]BAJ29820.1 hypothetical protein KSE_40280 [Kitasatospora setae KM-6054]